MYGKRSPSVEIGAGEYYLARIYIHPNFQNKGIARDAILLCEKEFADARFYFVDFPEDMDKNELHECLDVIHQSFSTVAEQV